MLRAKLVMLTVLAVFWAAAHPSTVAADDGFLRIQNGCGTLTIDWTNDRCSPPTIVRPLAWTDLTVIRSFRTHIRGNDPVYCLYEIKDGNQKWLAAAKYGRSVSLVIKICKLTTGNDCTCVDG